jgi:hypothetical protein
MDTIGGNGANCSTGDGGAGGGGGAGVPGGAGGLYMGSYDSDGYPGEAGSSYYSEDLIQGTSTHVGISSGSNGGNGTVNIIFLPSIETMQTWDWD